MNNKLTITVPSNFLEDDKITLVKHLIKNNNDFKLGVVLSKQNTHSSIQKKLTEISNDCIYSINQKDFTIEIQKIVNTGVYDYLLVENMNKPISTLQTFL